MTATPIPKPAAASMIAVTAGQRRCQGVRGGLGGRGGLIAARGWTGVPQAVQNWSLEGISRPHRTQ